MTVLKRKETIRASSATLLTVAALLNACGNGSDANAGNLSWVDSAERILRMDTIAVIEHERLWHVMRLRFVPDGLLVLTAGATEVLHFDRQGRLLASFGRQGEGPGEFRYPTDIVALGDSVYVLDSGLRRISLFFRGDFADSWLFTSLAGGAERLHVAESLVVGVQSGSTQDLETRGAYFYRRPIHVYRADRGAGVSWQEVLSFPGVESQATFVGTGVMHSLPAFRTTTSYELIEQGVLGVDHRSGRLALWSWDGRETTIREGPGPSYVTDAELGLYEEALEVRLARLSALGSDPENARASSRAAIDRWNGQVPRPVFEDLVSDGNIVAVENYNFGDDAPRTWLALDLEGSVLGRWTVPSNVRIGALHGWTLAAVARDSAGVESILLMRVIDR